MLKYKPAVTSNQHPLHFSGLSPQDFERLCLWLVEAEGFTHCEHVGGPGDNGCDILARSKLNRRVAFQCKRVEYLSAQSAIGDINKILNLPKERQPEAIFFIVSHSVSDNIRDQIRKAWGDESTCSFWAGSELDAKVKKHEKILKEFFDLSCGRNAELPFLLPVRDWPYFRGRDEELAYLKTILLNENPVEMSRILIVSGCGGVGKSALASRFATSQREHFRDGVISVLLDRNDADSIARQIARSAGCPLDLHDDRPARVVMQELFAYRQALLILDNANDIPVVRELLPSAGLSSVLITSRDRGLASSLGLPEEATIHLQALPRKEAVSLLAGIIGIARLQSDKDSIVDSLLRLTGCLPLALLVVGAALREQPNLSLKNYFDSLEDEHSRLARLTVYGVDYLNVRACLSVSLKALDEATINYFACASSCAIAGFSPKVAQAASGYDEEESRMCLGLIRRFSLIEERPGLEERYEFHPLIGLFAHEVAEDWGLLADAQERHGRFMISIVHEVEELDNSNSVISKLAQDIDDFLLAAEWLKKRGEFDIPLAICLGRLLDFLGRSKEAASLAEKHTGLATRIGDLTSAFQFQVQRAKQLMEQGHSIEAEKILVALENKSNDPLLEAIRLTSLGTTLSRRGRTDEAINAFHESIKIDREMDNQGGVGKTLNSLGVALLKKGKVNYAIKILSESLEIGRRMEKKWHVATVLNSLGGALLENGDTEKAIDAFKESISICSENPRFILKVQTSLGEALLDLRRTDEATEVFEKNLAIAHKMNNQSFIGIALHCLGRALQTNGQVGKALEMFKESLLIGGETEHLQHKGKVLNSLGVTFLNGGRVDDAISAFNESLEIGRKFKDWQHVAIVLTGLGRAQLQADCIEKGINTLLESLALHVSSHNKKGINIAVRHISEGIRQLSDAELIDTLSEQALAVAPDHQKLIQLRR